MQFNSIEFFFFLPIVLFLYHILGGVKGLKAQNVFIVLVSYLFYGWWNIKLLFLIAFTSLLSFLSGVFIKQLDVKHKSTHHFLTSKKVMIANVVINLIILGVFKYYNFFVENLIELFNIFSIPLNIQTLQLILPVGISFYTFQALSYTIDVYKKRIEPTNDIVAFFAYVSFFPQLVAGPIERATNLLPQFLHQRTFSYEKAVDGMRQMLWGFFMKVVIADNCANVVNTIFRHYTEANWFVLIIGAIFFTFQIYGDFAGYSNIAIGCARLFGFDLMENFRTPYLSSNIPEFWRRWHISLNTWFRDYVYIPLGGNKNGKLQQIRNTFVVFGLSGLWHGANWTYVAWGLYHGGLTALYKKSEDVYSTVRQILSIIVTFILVVIGWILFRAESISQAIDYCVRMSTLQDGLGIGGLELSNIQVVGTFMFITILMCTECLTANKSQPLVAIAQNRFIRWSIYILLILCMLVFPGKSETFIYFQF